jgi:hypothetical protein
MDDQYYWIDFFNFTFYRFKNFIYQVNIFEKEFEINFNYCILEDQKYKPLTWTLFNKNSVTHVISTIIVI